MSFFAGFVNGVFNGMDWRENRDQRRTDRERDETRWDWAQEDRTHTVSERERVARERTAATGRAAAARSRAEEERIAREQAFRDTMSVIEGGTPAPQAGVSSGARPPMSVTSVVPDPVRNNPNATSRAPMTITPSGAVPAAAQPRPAEVRQHNGGADLEKQLELSRQAAPADPRNRMDGEGAPSDRFADLESQMRQYQRPDTRSQAMSVMADQVMPAAREAATAERVPMSAPAPVGPQDEAAVRAAQGADAIPAAVARGRSVLERISDAVGRQALQQQALNQNTVGAGMSILGAEGAGAESFRTADRMQAIADRPQQTFGTPLRAPGGQVPMPPSQPGARPAPAPAAPTAPVATAGGQTFGTPMVEPVMPPRSAPRGQESQSAQAAPITTPQGMAQQAAAGPEQAPRTPGGAPMGSVQSVARAAMSVLESGRNDGNRRGAPPTDAEIASIAREAQRDFQEIGMLPIVRHHLERGDYAAAQAAEAFFNSRATQRATRSIMGALVSASYQDADGVLDGLAEAYNTPGYYADGQTVVREQSSLRFTATGDVEGHIAFRDDETGRVTRRNITGMQNALQMALGELMPETVWEQVQAGAFGQGEAAADPPSNSDRTAIRRQATDEARIAAESARGIGAVPTVEEIDQSEARLLRGRGVSASGIGAAPPSVFY